MDNYIEHIGVKRRSGRYPWGSGGELVSAINTLSSEGLSEVEIATALGMSTTELRNQKALATAAEKEAQRLHVVQQRDRGMSIAAIAAESGIPKSTVGDLLKPTANLKFRIIKGIADKLKEMVKKYKFVDVGAGAEIFMQISRTKLDNAITLLKNEGYVVHYHRQQQLGALPGKKTSFLVLGPPDSTYNDFLNHKTELAIPNFYTKDSGITFFTPDTINNISANRILVKYADDGGGEKDGLIELRKGVPEFSLGGKNYAQVRIGVDGSHYMKGMAVFRDDLPDGVDIIYNTSQENTGNPLSAMKPQVDTGASRFGAIVKPNTYLDSDGNEINGPINIVGEKKLAVEGNWSKWNKSIASQVLSKQPPSLAEKQLGIVYENAKAEFDDIASLTNPTVKNHLLTEFSDKLDKKAVDLKAAALPGQTTNVLLPDPKINPDHVFAPNYNNGDVVSLIRYPHGGTFEIPTLTVNNKTSEFKEIIGSSAKDAIAIHPDVAAKLSGADFDGDFVLVVPNKNKLLRTDPSIKSLENFDPKQAYPEYPGMKYMTSKQTQRLMGDVSNLITDMTIQGASQYEIAAAVRHSMVVIDAEKKKLNYEQSYIDNGIAALKAKYQGSARSGAATLISRAKSKERIPERKDYYTIDLETGEKVYSNTDRVYRDKDGNEVPALIKVNKLANTRDARSLIDPGRETVIEGVYAEHSNKLKALANQARLESIKASDITYSPSARKVYAKEYASLDAKYKESLKSKPIERKAQILAHEIYKKTAEANPNMSYEDKQKAKGRSLVVARSRINAKKPLIDITPREWEAIEMGAISPSKLKSILRNSDMDLVRGYATPKHIQGGLSVGKKNRANALKNAGYTNAEIANALGVSVSTIRDLE